MYMYELNAIDLRTADYLRDIVKTKHHMLKRFNKSLSS